jgi:endogenous inhibitor of DNA gyrase (YacG/DUF329 family)
MIREAGLEIPMAECKQCGKEFKQNRPFQVFCGERCKGAFHRHKYKQIAVEEAEDRREARLNGHGTPEQREQAKELLARIVGEQQPRIQRRI